MRVYCLRCRAYREISHPEVVTLKNGKVATRGNCTVCGRTVFRMGKA